jgi:hypothetical protein
MKGDKRLILSYSELITLPTFEERYRYLKQSGIVAEETFGSHRYLNQAYYTSPDWRRARNHVIVRDNGCDLGMEGYEIHDRIYVHHINPITEEDILDRSPALFDPDNLICVSFNTHQAIHYGDESLLPIISFNERMPGDTKLW